MYENNDEINDFEAVSPVVGVMLMLVVTIIIAAVVSGFAGDLAGTQEKAPTVVMNTHIRSDGSSAGAFFMQVKSVSEAIPTSDLKLTTSWSTTEKNDEETLQNYGLNVAGNTTYQKGDTIKKTTTILPYSGSPNTAYTTKKGTGTYYAMYSPIGFGSGVSEVLSGSTMGYKESQYWGKYALTTGTYISHTLSAPNGEVYPGSESPYTYGYDSMDAILGKGWWNLRPGDVVTVQLTHTPSGSLIYNEKVVVEA